MKKILMALFFFALSVPFYGQSQKDNLEKYWKYRERLRNRFMVVSENVMDYGVNIPASDIFYKTDSTKSFISWGDSNNNMSHYLSMLSTELWLLKHNKQDYSTTLKELYYAMLALERLDAYSESNLRWKAVHDTCIDDYRKKSFIQPGDINGFLLRNDVSQGFWNKYKNHFSVRDFDSDFKTDERYYMEEMSQDVIEHTLEGLGLVSKLVGTESVAGIPCKLSDINLKNRLTDLGIITCRSDTFFKPDSVNFSLWAKDIVKRFIRYIQSDEKYNLRLGPIKKYSTHWILINPVTKKCVLEGSGNDGGVAMISNGLIKAGEAITGENLKLYPGLISTAAYKFALKNPKLVSDLYNLHSKHTEIYDDNLIRSLSCTGNVLGTKTFSLLRKLRDTYNPYQTGHFPIYEHFPLMYLALNNFCYDSMKLKDNDVNSDKELYEKLLNSAPANGPASDCGVYDWTTTSRCLWPQNLGKHSDKHIEYNGLDYMMLHNLYYIAFRKEGFVLLKK